MTDRNDNAVITLEDLFAQLERAAVAPLLPMAERAAAIEKRRSYWWGHDCLFCPDSADAVIYAGPSDLISPPRWLDLCWRHYTELQWLADDLGRWDTDVEILARYEAWTAKRTAR